METDKIKRISLIKNMLQCIDISPKIPIDTIINQRLLYYNELTPFENYSRIPAIFEFREFIEGYNEQVSGFAYRDITTMSKSEIETLLRDSLNMGIFNNNLPYTLFNHHHLDVFYCSPEEIPYTAEKCQENLKNMIDFVTNSDIHDLALKLKEHDEKRGILTDRLYSLTDKLLNISGMTT